MVYAVVMTTIERFEQVLGRRVHWSNRLNPEAHTFAYVKGLRVYPHALRGPVAYYDSQRKALLFGYYPPPGDFESRNFHQEGMVFTCLSHDVVAHETTHAILDGMYRLLSRIDNLDMLAFHCAFADIVALFQHFLLPGFLRNQIANTQADAPISTLLGNLAMQLGAAAPGGYGALRSALGEYDSSGAWTQRIPDRMGFPRATNGARCNPGGGSV
jgi:hypothetical protein